METFFNFKHVLSPSFEQKLQGMCIHSGLCSSACTKAYYINQLSTFPIKVCWITPGICTLSSMFQQVQMPLAILPLSCLLHNI